jgi:tetratricopeptide (TPR) repeat protein
LGKYPDAAETLNNKGYALAKIKNMIKILKCIDKALKLIPEMSIYWIVRDLSWKK